MRGLSKEQTHRLLEDIQSLSLGAKHMADLVKGCEKCLKKDTLCSGAMLMQNLLDALGRDIMGMMNGNDKKV